jgi:Flp pilus assembly protein TadG
MRRNEGRVVRQAPGRRATEERGSATVEAAIVFPVVLFLIFGIIQGALWFHARHVALGAAQEGARVVAAEDGGDGEARAREFITNLTGGTLIRNVIIRESATVQTATVTVHGQAPSLIPGIDGLPVTQTATAPVERFTRPGS